MSIELREIGLKIKESRIRKGLTQEELAQHCGYTMQHISKIERRHVEASMTAYLAIVQKLGLTLDELFLDYASNHSKECETCEYKIVLKSMSNRQMKIIGDTVLALTNSLVQAEE